MQLILHLSSPRLHFFSSGNLSIESLLSLIFLHQKPSVLFFCFVLSLNRYLLMFLFSYGPEISCECSTTASQRYSRGEYTIILYMMSIYPVFEHIKGPVKVRM